MFKVLARCYYFDARGAEKFIDAKFTEHTWEYIKDFKFENIVYMGRVRDE